MNDMTYKSTRNSKIRVTAAEAITQGLSTEGGLFVPGFLPKLSEDDLEGLAEKSYAERAVEVLSLFLSDFSDEQLVHCVTRAYRPDKFDCDGERDEIVPMAHLYDGTYLMELWHGPTCAFKDMALQLLPYLLTTSAKIVKNEKEIVILVATSGDTGKAALEGFKDVDGTRIIVFYPRDGVSSMQKRQMTTQEGSNVCVCAINGNFDDAQTAVKSIFTDEELRERMERSGRQFSSANSINWGRLVPQIVYYVSAYCDLVAGGQVKAGELVNVCVPTGNFGNILAAYYAKKMGVPFGKLICASNQNRVLTDFIRTGIYDKNREFFTTISPSMDILISSNLERLLYDLAGEDDQAVSDWYSQLSKEGRFEVSSKVKARLDSEFYAGTCDDEATKATIREVFDKYSYLCDTHTAVAVRVYEEYRKNTGDKTRTLIASTANPYKFTENVLSAVAGAQSGDEYGLIEQLKSLSGMEVPASLGELRAKPIRFSSSIDRDAIKDEVIRILELP